MLWVCVACAETPRADFEWTEGFPPLDSDGGLALVRITLRRHGAASRDRQGISTDGLRRRIVLADRATGAAAPGEKGACLMADVAYLVLLIAAFTVLMLITRGLERL